MKSFDSIREETNYAGTEFLFTELVTGMTFLDVAETTLVDESRTRNRENALKAYDTALRYRDRVTLEELQEVDFREKLAILKNRLLDAGLPV